jgi:hypothetical protein
MEMQEIGDSISFMRYSDDEDVRNPRQGDDPFARSVQVVQDLQLPDPAQRFLHDTDEAFSLCGPFNRLRVT